MRIRRAMMEMPMQMRRKQDHKPMMEQRRMRRTKGKVDLS
jgi:hypothetical protein